MNIFGRKSKDEVMNHWIGFAENFTFSPQEFYKSIEQLIKDRKVPGLETFRVEYAEGGLFSDERIYLRLIRERLAFDICAAPFGTGYFFSSWSVYSPVRVRLWHLVVVFLIWNLIAGLLYQPLGPRFALIASVAFFVAVGLVFRNVVALKLADLDTALLKMPVIGPIYEKWFRENNTYYRYDTRLAYLNVVPKLIEELAAEVTGSKGIKLTVYHRAPILGELYKPVPPKPEPLK